MLSLATKFVPGRPAFEAAQRAGYRAAEFWTDADLFFQADSIASVAEEFSFRYAIHFPNRGPLSDEILESAAKLYERLNCTAMIIHQPMFDRYAESLQQLSPQISLAVENHILDLAGFERWADTNPGLTLDVEHLWKFTMNDSSLPKMLDHVEQFLDLHASKLHHVHLPGYLPGGEEHLPSYNSPEMAMKVLSMLDCHGFSKLAVSEADTPYQSEEYLRKDVQMFEEWLRGTAANRKG